MKFWWILLIFLFVKECDLFQNKLHGDNPSESKWAYFRNRLSERRIILLYLNIETISQHEKKVNLHSY